MIGCHFEPAQITIDWFINVKTTIAVHYLVEYFKIHKIIQG